MILRFALVVLLCGCQAAWAQRGRSPARLGVRLSSSAEQLQVAGVDAGSPAHKAGVATGDVLVTIDGRPASRRRLFRTLATASGARVLLGVRRDGLDFELPVDLPASGGAQRDPYEGVPRDAFRTRGVEGVLVLGGDSDAAANVAAKQWLDRCRRGSAPDAQQSALVLVGQDTSSEFLTRQRNALTDAMLESPLAVRWMRIAEPEEAAEVAKAIDACRGVWIIAESEAVMLSACRTAPVADALTRLAERRGAIAVCGPAAAAVGAHSPDSPTDGAAAPPALDWIPDACLRVGESALTAADLDETPHAIGLHLPAEAVVLFSGRGVRSVGAEPPHVTLADSPHWPSQAKPLDAYTDWTALRRFARRRADEPRFPPEAPATPNVSSGTLMIIGGGGMPRGLLTDFVERAGGDQSVIAVIPVSMPGPLPEVDSMERSLKRLGAGEVVTLHARTPEDADAKESLAFLQRATGVWFGGGRQWRFIDAYEGTQAAELMHQVLARGGVIAGSSAGASIQGDYMARGDPRGSSPIMADGYEKGLRFLPGVAIDQHFRQRNRFQDMRKLMDRHPQLLGIGLDEATAIVVEGSVATVVGAGQAHFYDRRDDAQRDEDSDHLSLKDGRRYDLAARREAE